MCWPTVKQGDLSPPSATLEICTSQLFGQDHYITNSDQFLQADFGSSNSGNDGARLIRIPKFI